MKVMIVKADERTQLRIFSRPDGPTTGVMMRRIDADGKRFTSTFLDTEGTQSYIRVFDLVAWADAGSPRGAAAEMPEPPDVRRRRRIAPTMPALRRTCRCAS